MKKAGIKPILGCELYISDQDCKIKTPENRKLSHLVVLAKNKKGWKNLIKIVSESNKLENLYYKPRLDLKTLGELVDGNLIAFAGHLGSTLSNKIMQLDDSDWKNQGLSHVGLLTDIFGKENFFLEAQLMDKQYNPDQVIVTEKVRELAKLTGLKVICTPDAHYAEKSDSVDQRILLCNNLKTTIADVNKKIIENESFGMDCFFRSDNYHILDSFEMSALHTEEEIENTNLINSMIELYDVNSKPLLPSFPCPPEFDQDEYLRHLCRTGWKTKIDSVIPKEDHEKYVDRIKMELGVLQGAGLSSYFLILQDVLNHVRQNNWLPGPGRGCFVPETNIKMSDGTFKAIKNVVVGDSVIDAFGNPQIVYDTLQYDILEDILELEFENGIIIRCTKDHKFLTHNRGWIEAQYLDDDDDIVEV